MPAFVLEQDNWNDYGFQTRYRLSYVKLNTNGSISEDLIGPIKILRLGQTSADGLLVDDPFNQLDDDYCSVGTSLDYYERVKTLPAKLRRKLLEGLRDVVFKPTLIAQFRLEEGWRASLFRDGKDETYLGLAKGLLTDDFSQLPGEDLRFTFTIPGWREPTEFNFSSYSDLTEDALSRILPARIVALVGRNGSGKSTLLARVARIAHGTIDERDRDPLSELGRIEPSGIGFPRVITVTFSPFDSFRLPGIDGRARRKILGELAEGEGRYAFIGLRDIAAPRSRATEMKLSVEEKVLVDADRLSTTRLKSIDQLTSEFIVFVNRVQKKKRTRQLDTLFDTLLEGSAFSPLLERGISRSKPEDVRLCFLSCSTGHKIAALVICGLIATLEKSSLVVFDEPETHLHPPLLASMMHALRKVLQTYEAFCIVATHSPVVIQESMARYVKLVRREGTSTIVKQPKAETFGESIGLITSEVFGLNAETTDYHSVLDKLIETYPNQRDIESLFLNGHMSHQARAYVMSRLLQAELEKK